MREDQLAGNRPEHERNVQLAVHKPLTYHTYYLPDHELPLCPVPFSESPCRFYRIPHGPFTPVQLQFPLPVPVYLYTFPLLLVHVARLLAPHGHTCSEEKGDAWRPHYLALGESPRDNSIVTFWDIFLCQGFAARV